MYGPRNHDPIRVGDLVEHASDPGGFQAVCTEIRDKGRKGYGVYVRIGQRYAASSRPGDPVSFGMGEPAHYGEHWYALRRATPEECAVAGIPYQPDPVEAAPAAESAESWVTFCKRR